MTVNEMMQQVDVERIYQTVTQLEGPRHPLDNMAALNAAADYIAGKLSTYGLTVQCQEFSIDGFDEPFKNVIGTLGDPAIPAVLLGSHYDTVQNCPGANDNLSAVAISLEVARICARMEQPPPLIVAAFTLEEGHPVIAKRMREMGRKYGILDARFRLRSAKLKSFKNSATEKIMKYLESGKTGSLLDSIKAVKRELDENLSEEERLYLKIFIDAYEPYAGLASVTKNFGLVGSDHYVQELKRNGTKIKEVIVYDTVGRIRKQNNTQKPLPMPDEMMQTHNVDIENQAGNFIAVFGAKNSASLLHRFLSHCEHEAIDIPYVGAHIPLEYSEMAEKMPDVLRSDHAHFWRENIPGIFLADTAEFRTELYHTPADTSEFVDFDMLEKLTRATIGTILKPD